MKWEVVLWRKMRKKLCKFFATALLSSTHSGFDLNPVLTFRQKNTKIRRSIVKAVIKKYFREYHSYSSTLWNGVYNMDYLPVLPTLHWYILLYLEKWAKFLKIRQIAQIF